MEQFGNYRDGYSEVAQSGLTMWHELVTDISITKERKVMDMPDRYNADDAIVSSDTKVVGVEIKARQKHYDDGLILEDYKWQKSPQSAFDSGCTGWIYANFINGNECYIYDYNTIRSAIEEGTVRLETKTTRKDTPIKDNGTVENKVYVLPYYLATEFRLIEGKWRKIKKRV